MNIDTLLRSTAFVIHFLHATYVIHIHYNIIKIVKLVLQKYYFAGY